MSLKRRDIIAWLLLLAAAVALSFGLKLRMTSVRNVTATTDTTYSTAEPSTDTTYSTAEPTAVPATTYPEIGVIDIFPTTVSETEPSAVPVTTYPVIGVIDIFPTTVSETYPAATSSSQWNTEASTGWSPTSGDSDVSAGTSRDKTVGLILVIAGVVLFAVGVLLLRQRQPLLGPDGVSALAAILCLLIARLSDVSQFAEILVLFAVLFGLRELVGWALSRCSLSWSMSERIASRTKSPSLALFGYYVWCAIPLIVGILLAVPGSFTLYRFICLLFLLAVELLTILCLLRYGAALRHLQRQLDSFRGGTDVSVREGPFSETEEKLKAVQSAHAEAIRQAVTGERFKVELISNVSHDLRTPLTAILGYGELLQQQPMSEEGKLQLSRLNQKAGYMRDLVDSLFELTKVSSGVLEPKREAIDLIRLLEQTIGLFDDQLTAAGLRVKRQYAMKEAALNTDGSMLHQVFANLLGNAIKYALKGSRIYLEAAETDTDYRVRMVNTASYEMDFTAEEIVQRFARGDKARSTQGSGIGLAIAQTYTASVGGTFRIVIDGDQFSAIVTLPKN